MNKDVQKTMFSSKSNEWGTPQDFFDGVNIKYRFTLDCCAIDDNAKCKKYYTKEDDALSKDWSNNVVWMNPPYGKGIDKWLKKAYNESRKDDTTVVCLIPARTDTRYWHDYCMKADEISFVKGRLKFKKGVSKDQAPAPFPSALVVFSGVDDRPVLAKVVEAVDVLCEKKLSIGALGNDGKKRNIDE